jgi:proteasome alpha subunit
MEVEIVVAELGVDPSGDRLFHIFYDGTVVDEADYTVLGSGEAEAIAERVKETYEPGRPLAAALQAAVSALAGPSRQLTPAELEVAVLARGDGRRAFRRLSDDDVGEALAGRDVAPEPQKGAEPADAVATEVEADAEAEGDSGGGPDSEGDGGAEASEPDAEA